MIPQDFYGPLLLARPPVPATLNEGGVNYKSEVAHLEYAPRRAYREWLEICEGILACGGDALFDFEPEDERFLDRGDLRIDAEGRILADRDGATLGSTRDLLTGRVFAANGPWVRVEDGRLRALLPRLVRHRSGEGAYYEELLARIAESCRLDLALEQSPHPWEGLADFALVADLVLLTYTVAGNYDAGVEPKTLRSSREGVARAADFAGVDEERRLYLELRYPHFHGDTVHFALRPAHGAPRLVQYPGGLFGDGAERVRRALGPDRLLALERRDAVEHYAANSRQVRDGVLVPDGVSRGFAESLEAQGLAVHRIPLFELFGKAGGGPACATLQLPASLPVPADCALRYRVRREEAWAREPRIARRLRVDPAYFASRCRG